MKYNVDNIVPVEDQLLVLLDKPHMLNSVSVNLTEDARERAKEAYKKNEMFEATEEDKVKESVKVDAKFRTGVVLKTPVYTEKDLVRYEVGQRVIFENGYQIPLDLLASKVEDNKCPVLIRKMHVRGVIVN